MKSITNILKFILLHPLTRKHKFKVLKRFIRWQLLSTIHRDLIYMPFIEKTGLLIKKGMTGATGNIYVGLQEFEEMSFVIHLLNEDDVFVDIGANIGSYTILASGVNKAYTISIEPILETFQYLKNNISINNLENKVEVHQCALGSTQEILQFTTKLDTVNHVIESKTSEGMDFASIQTFTLDEIIQDRKVTLIKMDVEGYEMHVLKGAHKTLANNSLQALIIEINGSCRRYKVTEGEIHDNLIQLGFSPFSYAPFSRKLTKEKSYKLHGNTIYIKKYDEVSKKIKISRRLKILDSIF